MPGKPLSVCGTHAPFDIVTGLHDDGTLHATAARLAVLRAEQSAHIGACSRGPIIAIPVTVLDAE